MQALNRLFLIEVVDDIVCNPIDRNYLRSQYYKYSKKAMSKGQ